MLHSFIHRDALKGRLHNADLRQSEPGSTRRQILDVGCGTGHWCFDMANSNPEMDVYGIDLLDFSELLRVRTPEIPNCRLPLDIDFTTAAWGNLRDSSFDFVRASRLCGSVPNWDQMYQTVYK